MLAILGALTGLLTVSTALLAWVYWKAIAQLRHFKAIGDLQKYRAECEASASEALSARDSHRSDIERAKAAITELKSRIVKYQQVVADFKSASQLKRHVKQLSHVVGMYRTSADLTQHIQQQKEAIERNKVLLSEYHDALDGAKTAGEVQARVTYLENYLAELKSSVEEVEEAKELQQFGFYRRRYDLDTSDAYKLRLDEVRKRQKRMIKDATAACCNTEWHVEGSRAEGKKMVNQQIKLMLRAFNGESDAATGKVKYNNAVSMQNRINRSFDQVNKLGETKQVYLTDPYRNLKLEELYVTHEYHEKKQEELEEQRRIREQMRDEAKAQKEIEKATHDAEKDEETAVSALEKARAELARETGKQTAAMQALVAKLEDQLKEALDRKAKAIARAQLTKSGHIYVLSNIGSFGEGVYKIGMTRRLEPLERVKELGDASVPFYFDVHAMIYSENAPQLEKTLHEHFENRRLNMVNLRREFFRVSLDEIRDAVAQHFGQVTFVTVPEADQYRETLAQRTEMEKPALEPGMVRA